VIHDGHPDDLTVNGPEVVYPRDRLPQTLFSVWLPSAFTIRLYRSSDKAVRVESRRSFSRISGLELPKSVDADLEVDDPQFGTRVIEMTLAKRIKRLPPYDSC
jgi:hypothetical protein